MASSGTARLAPWPSSIVQAIADVLGATSTGLTGSEIGHLLQVAKAPDPTPGESKRHRLYNALVEKQNTTQSANSTVAFIREAMAPVRYRDNPAVFTQRQQDLNEVLVHIGLRVNDGGQVAKGPQASTLNEAAERAGSIRTELRRRGTHAEVLRYCSDEILAKDNFHAVLEATKSMPSRLRDLTGLVSDGAALVDEAFGLAAGPIVRINDLQDDTDESEHKGFANLMRGLLGLYRNPTAHAPRIARAMSDDELLEALTTISMVHRRLDAATVSGVPPVGDRNADAAVSR